MEPEETHPKTIDRSTLKELKNGEGAWRQEVVQALSSGEWARWFKNRIEGNDPYFQYRREEYPKGANNLFFNLFRKLPDLDTEPASEGLGIYLRYLLWCHKSDEPDLPSSVHVQQALDLFRIIRARDTRARSELRGILRAFISDGYLLNRTQNDRPYAVSPTDLHRDALFGLVVLQERGDTSDWDVWQAHRTKESFAEAYDAPYDPRFALTAFSGLALSAPSPESLPDGMVADLLDLADAAECSLLLRHSLEALFIGRSDQRRELFSYLWEEVHRREEPREDWERLRSLLGRVVNVPPHRRIEAQRDRQTTNRGLFSQIQHPSGASSWTEASQTSFEEWTRQFETEFRISMLQGIPEDAGANDVAPQFLNRPLWKKDNFGKNPDLQPAN